VTELVARTAGRLLIIDPAGRVLMINEMIELGHPYWLVPGGGVEGDEQPREAAVREAFEETGLRLELAPHAPELLVEQRRWSYAGVTYDQTNHFFAVALDSVPDLDPAQLTELERDTFLGFRWWSPAEIEVSAETFYPAEIAALVRRAGVGPVELA
jgi:8-oxo-dGTP pyrophosphatase MutT (NUDIX family)